VEATRGLFCRQSDAGKSDDATHVSEPAAFVVRVAR
jgi:hypothetical protein